MQITEKYMNLIRVTVLLKEILSYPFCGFLRRRETDKRRREPGAV